MGVTTGTADAIMEFRLMLELLDLRSPASTNREEELNILTTSVNPIRLKNNPIELNEEAIRHLYETIIA